MCDAKVRAVTRILLAEAGPRPSSHRDLGTASGSGPGRACRGRGPRTSAAALPRLRPRLSLRAFAWSRWSGRARLEVLGVVLGPGERCDLEDPGLLRRERHLVAEQAGETLPLPQSGGACAPGAGPGRKGPWCGRGRRAAVGRPLSSAIVPPGGRRARPLGRGLVVRREHHADGRHHDVEGRIVERRCSASASTQSSSGPRRAREVPVQSSGPRSLATTSAPRRAAGPRRRRNRRRRRGRAARSGSRPPRRGGAQRREERLDHRRVVADAHMRRWRAFSSTSAGPRPAWKGGTWGSSCRGRSEATRAPARRHWETLPILGWTDSRITDVDRTPHRNLAPWHPFPGRRLEPNDGGRTRWSSLLTTPSWTSCGP